MSLFKKIMAPEVLNEAQDYKAIFNDIFRLWEMFLHTDAGEPFKEYSDSVGKTHAQFIKTWMMERVEDEVTWARTNLKKNDRIVWYLRYAKLGLLSQLKRGHSNLPGDALESAREFIVSRILPPFITKMNEYTKSTKGTPLFGDEIAMIQGFGSGRILDMQSWLTHYLSLPIAGIQNRVFGFEHFMTLKEDFRKLEHDWAESRKGRIDYDESKVKSIVLNFGDGFVWADLGRGACSEEADAMGHCGNVPSKRDGDTILSLRQIAQEGGQKFWRPCLTFILHGDGFLGEMKGRANEKPAERYHKYIVPLLKLDIIKGVRGGGYQPEKNFEISDLSEDEQWELLQTKPEFGEIAFAKLILTRGSDEQKARLMAQINDALVEVVLNEFAWQEPQTADTRDMDGWRVLGKFDLDDFISVFPKHDHYGRNGGLRQQLQNEIDFLKDQHSREFWPTEDVEKWRWTDWLVETPEIVAFFKAYCEKNYEEFSDFAEENDTNDLGNLCTFLDEEVKDGNFKTLMKHCADQAASDGQFSGTLEEVRKYFNNLSFNLFVGDVELSATVWPDEYDKKVTEFWPDDASVWVSIDIDSLPAAIEKNPQIVEQILEYQKNGVRYEEVRFDDFPSYHQSDWYTDDDKSGKDYFEENYQERMEE